MSILTVNYTSIAWNFEFSILERIWFFWEISSRLPNELNQMLQWINTISVILKCDTFSPLLS